MTLSTKPASIGARRRSGFRRWSRLSALAVLLVVAASSASIVLSTLALKSATARNEIEAQLSALTGLPVFIAGSAELTLLPQTRVTLENIRVGARTGDADAVMEIDGIVANLDLWEALLGRTRIEHLTLVRPELLSTSGFVSESENDRPPSQSVLAMDDSYLPLSRYIGAFLSRFGGLRSLQIRDGVFRMASAPGSLGISNANVTVTWPSRTSTARMSGSYVWNGQPAEIDANIATPLDFLAGKRSAVDITLASPPLTASFDGEGTIGDVGSFSGALSVATASLTHSIRWLGDPKTMLPDIGPLSIEAQLDTNGRRLNLRDARVTVDGFQGQGGLEAELPRGGRPSLAGTLAFDRLDLSGLAEAVAPLPQTVLDLQRRIAVDFIDGVDLDLRLSAAEGAIGTLPIGDLAATVKFKDGIATLDLGDATVLGGQAQARLTVDSTVRPPAASGVVSLAGVETAKLLAAIGVKALTVTGTSNLDATFDTPVTNWADVSQRNRINLDITASKGALSGYDARLLTAEAAQPFAKMATDGGFAFQTLRATLTSQGSIIDIEGVDVQVPAGRIAASGSLSAATKALDLSGTIEPDVPVGTAAAAPSSFRIQGIWPNPSVTSSPPVRPI